MHALSSCALVARLAGSIVLFILACTGCAGHWELEQQLGVDEAPPAGLHGLAVATNGDYAAVTVAEPPGVDVYRQARPGEWTFIQRIEPRGDAPALDGTYRFGESLAFSGDRLAVGVPKYIPGGSFYMGREFGYIELYRVASDGLEFEQRVTPDIAPGEITSSNFATSLAFAGDVLVAGSNFDTERIGRAFVFKERAGVFEPWQSLQAPMRTSDRHFGFAVALAADRLAIAEPGRGTSTAGSNGRVHVYRRETTGYVLEHSVVSPEPGVPGSPDRFGSALALTDGFLAVTQPGRAHMFVIEEAGIRLGYSVDAAVGDYFSVRPSLAFGAATLIVGENRYDPGGAPNQGRVRIYSLLSPEPQHELLDPVPGTREFGAAVAASGYTALVSTGAHGASADDAVYTYRFIEDPRPEP